MSKAKKLKKRHASFRRLTGLSVHEFDRLLAELEPVWKQARFKQANRKDRRRQPGAGHPFGLSLEDMLLVLLMYYRTYVTYAFLAVVFNVNESTICRIIRRLEPLLASIFRIPEKKKIAVNEDEILEAFVDATERPINRPQKKQKKYYSGKKKRHTLKAQIVVVRVRKEAEKEPEPAAQDERPTADRPVPEQQKHEKRRVRIAAVSESTAGKEHDKKLYDRTRLWFPAGLKGIGDSGYQGTTMQTPVKKPKNGQLTKAQKKANRELSQKRIVAEHGIGKMKIWRIAADKYRNPRSRHTVKMKNVAGLHNRMFS